MVKEWGARKKSTDKLFPKLARKKTWLMRSGASLTETTELARHSDVRMTMRYTHIGFDDQAKALASLPSPRQEPATRTDLTRKVIVPRRPVSS